MLNRKVRFAIFIDKDFSCFTVDAHNCRMRNYLEIYVKVEWPEDEFIHTTAAGWSKDGKWRCFLILF